MPYDLPDKPRDEDRGPFKSWAEETCNYCKGYPNEASCYCTPPAQKRRSEREEKAADAAFKAFFPVNYAVLRDQQGVKRSK